MFRVLFLVLTVMSSFVFAQTENKPQPIKFDEFGDIQETGWKEKLDQFHEASLKIAEVQSYIIIYTKIGQERKLADSLAKKYLDFLVRERIIDPPRIVVTYGGYRINQTTELWLIPPKAEPPIPTPDEKFKAELFAEVLDLNSDELKAKYESFQETLFQDWVTGYIISYGTNEQVEEQQRLIRQVRTLCRYDSTRITFVNGGDTGKPKTVFWLIPIGAESPTP